MVPASSLNVLKANVSALNQKLRRSETEVAELKKSTAYRVGMFVTWPLRKVYRIVRPIHRRKG